MRAQVAPDVGDLFLWALLTSRADFKPNQREFTLAEQQVYTCELAKASLLALDRFPICAAFFGTQVWALYGRLSATRRLHFLYRC